MANYNILSGFVKNLKTQHLRGGKRLTTFHINNKETYFVNNEPKDIFCTVDCELWNEVSDEFWRQGINNEDIVQVYGALKTVFFEREDGIKIKKTAVNVKGFMIVKRTEEFKGSVKEQPIEDDDLPF